MEDDCQLADQSIYKTDTWAAYVFAGEKDDVVLPWANKQMR